jgi:hypothetical protein
VLDAEHLKLDNFGDKLQSRWNNQQNSITRWESGSQVTEFWC